MRRARKGSALIEFALVMPVLVAITLGGVSLYLRILYRDSLETATELAVSSIARGRTGTDDAVIRAVERAAPFIPTSQVCYRLRASDFHQDVQLDLFYLGDAIRTLPMFNEPLAPENQPVAMATAINQLERVIADVPDDGSLCRRLL